ncbi:MAG: hypothetical protein ACK2T6_03340 [Anaerolineae bacterium]
MMDAPYLERLVREAVGSHRLRAEAARSLARLEVRDAAATGAEPARRPWPPRPGWQRLAPAVRSAAPIVAIAAAIALAVAVADRYFEAPGPLRSGALTSSSALTSSGTAASEAPAAPVRAADGSGMSAPGVAPGAGAVSGAGPVADERAHGGVPADGGSTGDLEGVDVSAPCGERTAGAVSASDASELVDTFQPVEFRVVRTKDTGRVTFLNSHDPYQGYFYVAVFPSEYELFPSPPAQYFKGRCIVVQGAIEVYRGSPQIVLHGSEDVRIVGD